MEAKNNYRKLVKLSDQLEHISVFLAENTTVMRNAKEKATKINVEERQNIEKLCEKVAEITSVLRDRTSQIDPKLQKLMRKCTQVEKMARDESQLQDLEKSTQNERIEAKVQSLSEASAKFASVEAELGGRREQLADRQERLLFQSSSIVDFY